MLQTKHPLSIVTVDYSNLFHSGLRALSASTIVDTTKPSSLLGSQSSGAQFWSYKTNSDSREPTSQWADVSLVSGSDGSFEWTHGVRSPEAEDVWMVKNDPLHMEMSKSLYVLCFIQLMDLDLTVQQERQEHVISTESNFTRPTRSLSRASIVLLHRPL